MSNTPRDVDYESLFASKRDQIECGLTLSDEEAEQDIRCSH